MKSHHFGKSIHLIFLYRIRHNNISWRPTTPLPESEEVATSQPPRLTSMGGLTGSVKDRSLSKHFQAMGRDISFDQLGPHVKRPCGVPKGSA